MAESSLKAVLAKMQEIGDAPIMKLSDRPTDMPRISSGSTALDIALGGGYPCGRFVEIYGPESGGKTLMTLTAIASCQRNGGKCLFVDAENSLEPEWAARMGVDTKELLITQPKSAQDTMNMLSIGAESGVFDLIVLDSVAALVPKEWLEQEERPETVGLLARILSASLSTLNNKMTNSKTVVLFVNQLRNKIGSYGNPETTPGGLAFKFYASIRVRVSKISQSDRLNAEKKPIGHDIQCKCIKNKTAPPFRVAQVPIMYAEVPQLGIMPELDLAYAAKDRGLLTYSGGVQYSGKALDGVDTKFKSWDDFYAWVREPKNAKVVQKMRNELVNGPETPR